MPIYQLSPINKNVLQATSGLTTYLLGSLNRTVAPTRFNVTAVQSNGATQTYFVTVLEGNLPVAGQLVSVAGSSVNAQFNVTNASIATVSFTDTPEDGIGSFTVTKAGTTVAKTADVAYGLAPQVEVGEAFSTLSPTGQTFNSVEVALMDNTGPDNPFTIRAEAIFPNGLPGACTVVLQSADLDIDTDYFNIGTFATVSGGILNGTAGQTSAGQIYTGIRARFIRAQVNGIAAGGSAKIVVKVLA